MQIFSLISLFINLIFHLTHQRAKQLYKVMLSLKISFSSHLKTRLFAKGNNEILD